MTAYYYIVNFYYFYWSKIQATVSSNVTERVKETFRLNVTYSFVVALGVLQHSHSKFDSVTCTSSVSGFSRFYNSDSESWIS